MTYILISILRILCILGVIIGLILLWFFPNVRKLLIRGIGVLAIGIWLLGGAGIYWVIHALAQHNRKTLDYRNGTSTDKQTAGLQTALRSIDLQTLIRLPVLPLSKSYVQRARILVSLPLMYYEWNDEDYDMWLTCYRENTLERNAYLKQWETQLRNGDPHAPPPAGGSVPAFDQKAYNELKEEIRRDQNRTLTPAEDEQLLEKISRLKKLEKRLKKNAKKKVL